MGHEREHRPDYAEIARLEVELGLAGEPGSVAQPIVPSRPVPQPHPAAPPPSTDPAPFCGPVPEDALYKCRMCGHRRHAGSIRCAFCGAEEWCRDED